MEHRGFKYFQVEGGWRIQFPGGHKTPVLILADEDAVKAEIDKIITEYGGG